MTENGQLTPTTRENEKHPMAWNSAEQTTTHWLAALL